MIVISDLTRSYTKEVTAAETLNVVGGAFDIDSYNLKISAVDITQANVGSAFSYNVVGAVVTNQ